MRLSTTNFAEEERALSHKKLGERSVERIGNTPLLRLERIGREFPHVQILGKAEWCNPGGSIKDRAAWHIVREGRRGGKFTDGKVLLDSTSGNTGIAYAMIGAAEGFPVTLCMPENVSIERKRILFAYGAKIIYTDPADGSDGAIRMARELYPGSRKNIFTPTSIPTTPTGKPITMAPRKRSGSKRKGGSRISLPCWAPAEHSWEHRGD